MRLSGLLLLAGISLQCSAAGQDPSVAQRARINYLMNCAACHQVNGKGSPGQVPDLREYLGLFAQHEASRSFLARVPGASGAPITDQELADVLNWILYTMNAEQLTPEFVPYTAGEVGEYRKDPVVEIEKVRHELIERVVKRY
jgi:mono/diheme cytochrome c family protein